MGVARWSVVLSLALLATARAATADTLCIFALSHPHGEPIANIAGSSRTSAMETVRGTLNLESHVLSVVPGVFSRESILAKDPILEDFWREHDRHLPGIDGSTFTIGATGGAGALYPSRGPVSVRVPDRLPINAPEPGVLALLACGMAAAALVPLKRAARS